MRGLRLDSIIDSVGNTPMIRLRSLEAESGGVPIFLKLEYCNPGGSVKDRAARQMIVDAIEAGELDATKTLIDATSGNTGVAYSLVGAALGHRVHLVMPSNVSQARKDIIKAFGTEITFSDPMEGTDGSIGLVREIVADAPDRFYYPDQYSNPSNPLAHYLGTGAEIIEQVGPRLTHFVTGLGTTGTMMGTTRRLKEYGPHIQCIAVEPREALHGLEGLKHMESSLIPAIFDPGRLDARMHVGTEDGWDMTDRLAAAEGLHIGHSSGANVYAALQLAKSIDEGLIVTIACDRGDRYFAPRKWEAHYEW